MTPTFIPACLIAYIREWRVLMYGSFSLQMSATLFWFSLLQFCHVSVISALLENTGITSLCLKFELSLQYVVTYVELSLPFSGTEKSSTYFLRVPRLSSIRKYPSLIPTSSMLPYAESKNLNPQLLQIAICSEMGQICRMKSQMIW